MAKTCEAGPKPGMIRTLSSAEMAKAVVKMVGIKPDGTPLIPPRITASTRRPAVTDCG